MNQPGSSFTLFQRSIAWTVHIFTSLAAIAGLVTLIKIQQHLYVEALWFMGIAVLIDALDGTLARYLHVKIILPHFDGALLDNMVDFLNYVITPSFFLYSKANMLPQNYSLGVLSIVILTSCYQFCQSDAKTPDHFFKGFPCFWNIAVFYMFIFSTSALTNSIILLVLSILIFIPIKYVYPSRLDYLTESKKLKVVMHCFSIFYAISFAVLLWSYPNAPNFWLGVSLAYACIYLYLSLYRSWYPLIKSKFVARKTKKRS